MKLDKIIDDWLENSKNYKIKFSEKTTASTSTSSSCSASAFTTTTANTDAFNEPRKKTKTEKIMEFFSPPGEEQEMTWTEPSGRKTMSLPISDIVSVRPMTRKSDTIMWSNYVIGGGKTAAAKELLKNHE